MAKILFQNGDVAEFDDRLRPTVGMAIRNFAETLARDAANMAAENQPRTADDFRERSEALSALANQVEE